MKQCQHQCPGAVIIDAQQLNIEPCSLALWGKCGGVDRVAESTAGIVSEKNLVFDQYADESAKDHEGVGELVLAPRYEQYPINSRGNDEKQTQARRLMRQC